MSETGGGGIGFRWGPVHHVQLAVPSGSEPACREFWCGVLGMSEVGKPPVLAARGGCWFRAGAFEVHLGVEEPFAPARKAHPGVLVQGSSPSPPDHAGRPTGAAAGAEPRGPSW